MIPNRTASIAIMFQDLFFVLYVLPQFQYFFSPLLKCTAFGMLQANGNLLHVFSYFILDFTHDIL